MFRYWYFVIKTKGQLKYFFYKTVSTKHKKDIEQIFVRLGWECPCFKQEASPPATRVCVSDAVNTFLPTSKCFLFCCFSVLTSLDFNNITSWLCFVIPHLHSSRYTCVAHLAHAGQFTLEVKYCHCRYQGIYKHVRTYCKRVFLGFLRVNTTPHFSILQLDTKREESCIFVRNSTSATLFCKATWALSPFISALHHSVCSLRHWQTLVWQCRPGQRGKAGSWGQWARPRWSVSTALGFYPGTVCQNGRWARWW